MPRGGARPGAGRKRSTPLVEPKARKPAAAKAFTEADGKKTADAPPAWPFGTAAPTVSDLSPLDYLLSVVRSEEVDPKIRLQAAAIAAPYMHAKPGASGKKVARQEAASKVAGGGKFAPAAAPKLVVSNR